MAIGAANLALVDLHTNRGPCPPAAHVGRYPRDLVPQVVEFEDDDVGLTAIDAGMFAKVSNDLGAQLLATRRCIS
jgi:hypothetical protein